MIRHPPRSSWDSPQHIWLADAARRPIAFEEPRHKSGELGGTVLKLVFGMVSYQSAAVRGVDVRRPPPQPRSQQLALVLA